MADEFEITPEQLAKLRELHRLVKGMAQIKKYNKFVQFTPYPKQEDFFELAKTKRQRMFNAGNRLGKTEAGAFETTCHLTGQYPDWWKGVRFAGPISAWAVGLGAKETRDIIQEKLCGDPADPSKFGTGMVPLDKFEGPPILGRGLSGAYDTIRVKHYDLNGKPDGISILSFKTCEQGWTKFQGTSKDWIWIDEEPDDYKIYTECLTRTLDAGGYMIVTYTPLSGESSDLWQAFYNPVDPAKGVVSMSAYEVLGYPNSHLDPDRFAEIMLSWPAHERETRASGKPSVGAGAVFAHLRQDLECPPIYDPGGYALLGWGMDFGGMGGTTLKSAHPFGAVLIAYDPVTDIVYIIREIRLPGGRIMEHAMAMKAICAAAPCFWPHDGHRTSNEDKTKDTRDLYKEQGLRMWHEHATFKQGGYSTEAGLLDMDNRIRIGKLKVCSNLPLWWGEFGSYSRDEKGEIVKINDDLMSASRIGCMMVPRFGRQVPLGSGNPLFTGRTFGPRGGNVQVASGMDADPWGND